jgi:hypothetical protein
MTRSFEPGLTETFRRFPASKLDDSESHHEDLALRSYIERTTKEGDLHTRAVI